MSSHRGLKILRPFCFWVSSDTSGIQYLCVRVCVCVCDIPQDLNLYNQVCWWCIFFAILLGFAVILAISMERFLPEKLTGSQLVNIFPAFYGTRKFIAVFKRSRHQRISPSPRPCGRFCDIVSWGMELSPRPTPPFPKNWRTTPYWLSATVVFNIFARTLHIWGPFHQPQPEDGPCLVTGTHYNTLSLITAQRCNNARWAIAQSPVIWRSVSTLNNFTATTPVSLYWNCSSHMTE
jgi:hypothetical protein